MSPRSQELYRGGGLLCFQPLLLCSPPGWVQGLPGAQGSQGRPQRRAQKRQGAMSPHSLVRSPKLPWKAEQPM